MKLLVTGGAGFIGSNVIHRIIDQPEVEKLINLDCLTYAGHLANLERVSSHPKYVFEKVDLRDKKAVFDVVQRHVITHVMHLAAESHVDRSITGPGDFIHTNIVGTFHLLEACRTVWGSDMRSRRFHHVSTDEVYGSLGPSGYFTETTPYAPNSPYSASKAGSDHLVNAYHHTYGMPVTMTNCSNNYGPYQHAEKFIPTVIRSALAENPIPIYGAGLNIRDWLYVADHCEAIDAVVRRGRDGQTYLIGGQSERRNIDIAQEICGILDEVRPRARGKYADLLTSVTDRLGHDFRYAIDCSLIESELGWKQRETFATGIRKTVDWYLANPAHFERHTT